MAAPAANTTAFSWAKVSGSYDVLITLFDFFHLSDDQRYEVFRRVALPEGERFGKDVTLASATFSSFTLGVLSQIDYLGIAQQIWTILVRMNTNRGLRLEWPYTRSYAKGWKKWESGTLTWTWLGRMSERSKTDAVTSGPRDHGGIEAEHNQNLILTNKESGGSTSLQPKHVDKGTYSKQPPMSSGMSRHIGINQDTRTANHPFSYVSSFSESSQLPPLHTIDTSSDFTFAVHGHQNTPTRHSQATSEGAKTSSAGSNNSDNLSSTMSLPPLTICKLNMVHQRDLSWHEGTPIAHRASYVSQDQTAFHRGGPVFRVSINGQWEDVMICGGCYYCQNGKEQTDAPIPKLEELSSQAAKSPTQGLPFVHSGEVHIDSSGSRPSSKFLGTARNWRLDYPAMMRTDITFTRGTSVVSNVAAMQCINNTCKVCNPDTEMDSLLRSWQPGGEEYEKDQAERLKYDQMRRDYVASVNAEVEVKKITKKAAMKSKVEAAAQAKAMKGSKKK
ncbi:hypothetical protein LTR78_009665 [Recurvomyces mirabilis]|uniref:Uncharacterized protein n=1 Tax=Recurvomyces mirabilis TaxID=574656 RepID=A0AAE0TMS3_9PEZI|nr:hypothetical protein LTR78_009665 [Recurvomyces mirabilis]KAK5150293.1 hypothetical protein LTS14_010270 [Recurvomyces mirabilis]